VNPKGEIDRNYIHKPIIHHGGGDDGVTRATRSDSGDISSLNFRRTFLFHVFVHFMLPPLDFTGEVIYIISFMSNLLDIIETEAKGVTKPSLLAYIPPSPSHLLIFR
jgi:hypothetical protein